MSAAGTRVLADASLSPPAGAAPPTVEADPRHATSYIMSVPCACSAFGPGAALRFQRDPKAVVGRSLSPRARTPIGAIRGSDGPGV